MPEIKSFCEKGIKVVFIDGQVRDVAEITFSRCLVSAAYQRLLEGACTYREFAVDVEATKWTNKSA